MPDIALNTGDTAAVLIALSEKSKGQVRRGKKMRNIYVVIFVEAYIETYI